MEPRSYTTIDKSGWGEGPWQSEPDKMQWQHEATRLPCLIVRGPMGALCGYVGISEAHPAHGLSYDGTPDEEHRAYMESLRAGLRGKFGDHEITKKAIMDLPERPKVTPIGERLEGIDVHGGLSFAGGYIERADPSSGICHVPAAGEPDTVWWFGFDCCHAFDLAPKLALHRKEMDALLPAPPRLLADIERAHLKDVYRDIPYVQAEVASLAKQLAAIRV